MPKLHGIPRSSRFTKVVDDYGKSDQLMKLQSKEKEMGRFLEKINCTFSCMNQQVGIWPDRYIFSQRYLSGHIRTTENKATLSD